MMSIHMMCSLGNGPGKSSSSLFCSVLFHSIYELNGDDANFGLNSPD